MMMHSSTCLISCSTWDTNFATIHLLGCLQWRRILLDFVSKSHSYGVWKPLPPLPWWRLYAPLHLTVLRFITATPIFPDDPLSLTLSILLLIAVFGSTSISIDHLPPVEELLAWRWRVLREEEEGRWDCGAAGPVDQRIGVQLWRSFDF